MEFATQEWVMLVNENENIFETMIDVTENTTSESSFTSDDALAEKILVGDIAMEVQELPHLHHNNNIYQESTKKSISADMLKFATNKHYSKYMVALLVLNALSLMLYVYVSDRMMV